MRNLQSFLSPNPGNPLLWHPHLSVSGFGFYRRCEWKRNGRSTNDNSHSNRAVPRDSEFEIDPDKAREALRKLDEQLEFISQKQTSPVPKIKASSPYNARDEATKDPPDTGLFLPYVAFGLLIFTLIYNIIFIKVIKPSVDGPEAELAPARSSIMTDILKAELLPSMQFPPSPEVSDQP